MKLRGEWLRHYKVLMGFFFFDYLSTVYYCTDPAQEGNPIARPLMIAVGDISLGMTTFIISYSILLYGAMLFFSYVTENAKKQEDQTQYNRLEKLNSIFFPVLAGADFGLGATSWFWYIPPFIKMAIGTFLYLYLDTVWIRKVNKSFPRAHARARAARKVYARTQRSRFPD